MSRLVPYPVLSLMLVGMWLLLTRVSLGHLLLGSAIALIAGRAMATLQPAKPRIRRWAPMLRLLGIVSLDILRSNFAVAWLILTGGRHGRRRSGFVEIPLRLRSPSALALLAVVITATPGTAWLEHDAETGVLLLHVFDLVDEDAWRHLIRNRYEALLLEIFE
ncbi:Na+/H+ antiporter subunit E [Cereibacter sphaeroides]|uniref:Na+/H+ antiporter subunit E n=1 Tax=Cereibacter sphaeroides TaxID=1063 RepID=UPI001F3F7D98|nr:Na+/H+ antiporter subunit E [Cereibacter sphaeroides]MCE6951094.1 Na+/H+ antiporter subunit E [Cereibacter sphaeroides]MCE6958571.1 Na+/H+ antiporter subunit E [Cereibacter sphaeroides]MCE6968996.1 Na+/H+ antiporter subunit E [Cereibacter sphaeroides]MCE6972386.1 Na+/H+ antiporter subunit E [Cereibacter sphaeroides]